MKHNPEVLEIRSEHRRVYESVRSQEPELAVQTIREHLTASKERVIREIKQLQQDVDAAQ